jgi:hypothetical protein
MMQPTGLFLDQHAAPSRLFRATSNSTIDRQLAPRAGAGPRVDPRQRRLTRYSDPLAVLSRCPIGVAKRTKVQLSAFPKAALACLKHQRLTCPPVKIAASPAMHAVPFETLHFSICTYCESCTSTPHVPVVCTRASIRQALLKPPDRAPARRLRDALVLFSLHECPCYTDRSFVTLATVIVPSSDTLSSIFSVFPLS